MKKKLLITIGDSFTEGYGCYDYTKPIDSIHHLDGYQFNRFHELGWPNKLGKKLNYDKVLNLGWGGSSNSAHVKLFVEKILPKDFSDYNVLVVWMLTLPQRFSFHSGGKISKHLIINPNTILQGEGEDVDELETAYVKTIENFEFNSILETIFYIKCMEQICENNSYELLITSWDEFTYKKIKMLYNSKYFMKEINNHPIAFHPNNTDTFIYKSKICGHPNEIGYEKFASNMFDSIQKYNSHLINKNNVENFEWKWEGNPKNWNELYQNKFI